MTENLAALPLLTRDELLCLERALTAQIGELRPDSAMANSLRTAVAEARYGLERRTIWEEIEEFFDEPDEVRAWIWSPNRLLGGDTPASRIRAGKIEDVRALIDLIRDGAVV